MNVLDITPFIEAESDRIIGDDLIAGPQTHTVAAVEGMVDDKKKKRMIIRFQDSQKPFIPCKGMVRLLGSFWGPNAVEWVGRTMVIYRDPDVRFGADMTGGVRICAVSGIDEAVRVPIRTSQKSVKQYNIEPLQSKPPAAAPAQVWADAYIAAARGAETLADLETIADTKAMKLASLEAKRPELHAQCIDALQARREFLAPAPDADELARRAREQTNAMAEQADEF